MRYLSTYRCSTLLILWLSFSYLVASYNGTSCCLRANDTNDFANTRDHPLPDNPVCGQVYGDYDPAPPVYVSYAYCHDNCAGIGLSQVSEPGQWAGPIVQFILPAVIFSATVPRRRELTFRNIRALFWTWEDTDGNWLRQAIVVIMVLARKPTEMLIVFIDNLVWIFAIVTGAGPMLIGGLYEAWLDHFILKAIRRRTLTMRGDRERDVKQQRELLVILALGNLTTDGNPIEKAISTLSVDTTEEEQAQSQARLISLLGAQSDFGTAVGAPVLFYLGAFVYTILDLQSDPSDQDSAISLAFGVEWMVIVHVAIVSGCLLAANNPATSTAIVGQRLAPAIPAKPTLKSRDNHYTIPSVTEFGYFIFDHIILLRDLTVFYGNYYLFSDAYDTTFQPVWMWRRGANKRQKIKNSQAWLRPQSPQNKDYLIAGRWSWFLIWISAVILVAVPPAAGAVVSYATPPIGVSCRSLSFMIYAGCQVVLCTTYVFRHLWHYELMSDGPSTGVSRHRPLWIKRLLAHNFWNFLPLLFSAFCCVGGTVMQVVGVFRNCLCYTITDKWLKLDQAYVNLASDTAEARGSTKNWITMGITATAFMVFTAYAGWWYQNFVRRRFLDAVRNLYTGQVVEKSWVSKQLTWRNFKLGHDFIWSQVTSWRRYTPI